MGRLRNPRKQLSTRLSARKREGAQFRLQSKAEVSFRSIASV
jgi:hypothetical protein